MKIEIAGIGFHFKFKNFSPIFIENLKRRYKGFFSTKRNKCFHIIVKKVITTKRYKKPEILKKGNIIHAQRHDFKFQATDFTGKLEINESIYSFDSFLRILVSYLIVKKKGLLVHASSFIYKGKAYIFVGKSGAGKTTISRLSRKYAYIMSDELTPIFVDGRAYSSPFWGMMKNKGKNISAPIGKIYIIKKSKTNKTYPLSIEKFLLSFLPCIMNFNKSTSNLMAILDISRLIYKNIKAEKLFFNKNYSPLNRGR